jgi:site-specific recombinase XerD
VTLVKLKYVDRFKDRQGQWRYYFRRGKGPRIALAGKPGTPEFMAAYQSALELPDSKAEPTPRGAPGTFDRLVQDYFASADFLRLATHTQHVYRLVIERLLRDENIGHRLVHQMTRKHVVQMIGKRAATPGAANDVLKKLKILMHFAVDNGWRRDDPTVRVKSFAEGEFHTWTDKEIAAFEKRWPVGSRARTAFALLVYTGQRLSDVARMAWTDVEANAIRVVQGKTKAKLLIPLHPELCRVLAEWRKTHVALLTTNFGKPFSSKGFGNWMADRIDDAGLDERCVTHGLRKAAARRLAEAGCSANEIAAITGHMTLKEVGRYTKAAEQRTLATAAIERLSKQKPNENSQT